MKKILKYKLELFEPTPFDRLKVGRCEILMPWDAKVISAGAQGRDIFVWAEVEQSNFNTSEGRRFRILGTGWEFEEVIEEHPSTHPARQFEKRPIVRRFLNTVTNDYGFVFHVFEETYGVWES